ncbi:TRAP transporter small permease [Chloroflexota bacterium]
MAKESSGGVGQNSSLEKSASWLDKTERGFSLMAGALVVILVVWTIADILWRFIFGGSVGGAIEASELMMIILSFVALSAVQAKRKHIQMTLVVDKLPLKAQIWLELMALVMIFVTFLVIAVGAPPKLIQAWQEKWIMGYGVYTFVQQWPGFLFIVIASALLCVRVLFQFIEDVRHLSRLSKSEEKKTIESPPLETGL